MCARVLSPFFDRLILTDDVFREFGVRKTIFWWLPPPGGNDVYVFTGGQIPEGLHFPYGIPVEPDVHL